MRVLDPSGETINRDGEESKVAVVKMRILVVMAADDINNKSTVELQLILFARLL